MKNFKNLNYYEMLDVPVNANDFEIRQAYKDTLSIYSDDSPVTYSLFSDQERDEILGCVELAFSTLIDRKAKDNYNMALVEAGRIDEDSLDKKDSGKLVPIFGARGPGNPGLIKRKVNEKIPEQKVQALISGIMSKERISGADLKALREEMGIELRDVYEVTRISVAVLGFLEADNLSQLPHVSYIKNFLKIYAGFFKIDSDKLVKGYLKNINAGAV